MYRKSGCMTATIAVLTLMAGSVRGSTHEFFKGKTLRIVVGFSAGGGFDTYSRAIARQLGKHIPGNPTVIVDNMPGAGSLITANHVYNVAKPDGLSIGNFIGGLLVGQILGRPGIQFDALKFEYVGAPTKEKYVCALTKASGITDVEKWLAAKTPVKLGGTGPGAGTDDVPKILRGALGLPIQLVSGYKGTSDIRLAAESGEVAGGCWGWPSVKVTWSKGLKSGDVVVVVQMVPKPHRDLPAVPLAVSLATTEEARQLIQAGIHDPSIVTYLYALPPGTAKDRVQILRRAFEKTLEDPEFLADAEKSGLDLDPVTGEEAGAAVARFFKLSPAMVNKLKGLLAAK
ncbi:MAG: hypothetical protein HYT78_00990 [Deltaproteobacteria bacterium]|nr:hypothetical protein [Deltaproteobacteria bacterium]